MDKLAEGLKRALNGASDVVVVYTDLSRLPLWCGSKEATLEAHADAILGAAEGRTVLFPTFNYDWCRTGRYDPDSDPSQVGELNEWVRVNRADYRTLTPVFNFAVVSKLPLAPWLPSSCPFAHRSVFSWLVMKGATVLGYGAPLYNCSALHVAEYFAHAPYRYVKDFRGFIAGDGKPHTLHYPVAPPEGVTYDWAKVERLLIPLFSTHDVGCGSVRVGRADGVYHRLMDALRDDEHAFLTEPPTALYERFGKPLTVECEVAA